MTFQDKRELREQDEAFHGNCLYLSRQILGKPITWDSNEKENGHGRKWTLGPAADELVT